MCLVYLSGPRQWKQSGYAMTHRWILVRKCAFAVVHKVRMSSCKMTLNDSWGVWPFLIRPCQHDRCDRWCDSGLTCCNSCVFSCVCPPVCVYTAFKGSRTPCFLNKKAFLVDEYTTLLTCRVDFVMSLNWERAWDLKWQFHVFVSKYKYYNALCQHLLVYLLALV